MGTSGVYGFILDGKVYAMYNNYDSYPEGLGVACLDFIKANLNNLDQVRDRVRKLVAVNADEQPTAEQLADLGYKEGTKVDWYCELRGVQGCIEQSLAAKYFIDSIAELSGGSFCSYGYLINLDDLKLEVYCGSVKQPHYGQRFSELPSHKFSDGTIFYPMEHRLDISFSEVLNYPIEAMVNACEQE